MLVLLLWDLQQVICVNCVRGNLNLGQVRRGHCAVIGFFSAIFLPFYFEFTLSGIKFISTSFSNFLELVSEWWCQQLLDLSFSLCSKYVLMHFIICKIISGISLELSQLCYKWSHSLSLNKRQIHCNQKFLVNFCSSNFGIICQTGTGNKLLS